MLASRPAVVAAVASALLVAPRVVAQPPSALTYGITGSTGDTPADLNPTILLGDTAVQRALLMISAEPRARATIDSVLRGSSATSDGLVRAGLVRQRGSAYGLGFAFFSRADVARIRSPVDPLARSLAHAFMARRGQIDSQLARYPVTTVDRRALAFIVIGCFALDWDALEYTERRGYRTPASHWPWGATYAIWAEQRENDSLRAVYWGSHTTEYGSAAVTTFGDHYSLPRAGFPDLNGRLAASPRAIDSTGGGLGATAAAVARDAVQSVAANVSKLMLALRAGPQTLDQLADATALDRRSTQHLVSLLDSLQYVRVDNDRVLTIVPVLAAEDSAFVHDVVALSRGVDSTWLEAHYAPLRAALDSLSAARQGVPYGDLFTQIWHYVFGLTNRELVRRGMFADPYAPNRRWKGFFPVVWATNIARLP